MDVEDSEGRSSTYYYLGSSTYLTSSPECIVVSFGFSRCTSGLLRFALCGEQRWTGSQRNPDKGKHIRTKIPPHRLGWSIVEEGEKSTIRLSEVTPSPSLSGLLSQSSPLWMWNLMLLLPFVPTALQLTAFFSCSQQRAELTHTTTEKRPSWKFCSFWEDECLYIITLSTHPPRALRGLSVPVLQNPPVPYNAPFFSFVERVLY